MNVKTYTGTKTVTARPMNRQEYNDYRNWILPADEDGSDDAFLSSPERADADVEALEAQLGIMQSYLAVLAIRLEEANA